MDIPKIAVFSVLLDLYFVICYGHKIKDTLYATEAIDEFYYHEETRPLVLSAEGLPLDSTYTQDGHKETLSISLSAFRHNFTLSLYLNRDLLSSGYIEKYYTSEDKEVLIKPSNLDSLRSHCYYHGRVQNLPRSSVALSTCDGVRGEFHTEDEIYYIEPTHQSLSSVHRIFRASDKIPTHEKCGVTDVEESSHKHENSVHHSPRFKREIHWPYDTTEKTRIIELYVANDHTQYVNHGRDINKVLQRTKDIINVVSSLYRPLNLYIALVGVEIWTSGDKISVENSAENTMNNFIEYRRDHINYRHPNDNAQLITGHVFTDGVVGKAVKTTICTYQYSGGVNMDHSTLIGPVATTIAHEMGHNLGLQHDDSSCDCGDNRCIMAATSGGKNPTKWSSCSAEQLGDSFHQGLDYCLQNLPEQLHGSPVCGNGFKEEGEECDCGLPEDCTSNCCNATTCALLSNATCATGLCCDKDTCQFKAPSTPCREASGECDLPEYCHGNTEWCPSDVYKINGVTCSGGQAYCHSGMCRTRETQCRKLWGPTGQDANSICYTYWNVMGNAQGDCGFTWRDKSYVKCAEEDVFCGRLKCTHRAERLAFWKEALCYLIPSSYVYDTNRQRHTCKSAIFDVGLNDPDESMVPDGAVCGEGKLCENQRCVNVSDLEVPGCADCHGNGVCNTLGQCHCDAGYAPPSCDRSGGGGSMHSGPANEGGSNVGLIVGLVMLFVVILPAIVVAAILAYRHREKLKKLWNGRPYKYSFLYRAKPPPPPNSASVGALPSKSNGVAPGGPAPPPPINPKFGEVKRSPSVRGMPISPPQLNFSTNSTPHEKMTPVGVVTRPLPAPPAETTTNKIVPTRPAPTRPAPRAPSFKSSQPAPGAPLAPSAPTPAEPTSVAQRAAMFAQHSAAPPVAVIPPTYTNSSEPQYRNVPPARPKRPESLVQRQNSRAGSAAVPANRPTPPVKPVKPNTAPDSSSHEEPTTNDNKQPTYANEQQKPKKPLVPKNWSPAVKFQPTTPNSESTSISFQNGNATQGSNVNSGRVPVLPVKPPVGATKPSLGGATKPPLPAVKPDVHRAPSNPGVKPKVAPKPGKNSSNC